MRTFEDQRERAIGRVRDAYVRGALNTSTFELRIDACLGASSRGGLRDLLWDLRTRSGVRDVIAARSRYFLDAVTGRIADADAVVTVDLSELAHDRVAGTWTVGRSAECDLTLSESRSVSRIHADISLRDGVWHLRDRRSRNGTWVGAQRVTHTRLDPKVPVRLGELDVWWTA